MLNDVLLNRVKSFPADVKELILSAREDGDHVDALGTVRQAEREAANLRRTLGAEVEDGDAGQYYQIVRKRSADRSFNLSSLIPKFAEAWGVSPLQAIARLHREGAIQFDWKIRKLRDLARDAGVTITTAQREITDGDAADIGEVWKDGYPSYEPVEPS